MHLLNTETQTLQEFIGDDVPPYAILSHRWGSSAEETTFRDVREGRVSRETSGFRKVQNACHIAKHKYGLNYVWIDTCCINKESSAELSEAINSMFMWYRNATICIAFLNDVAPGSDNADDAFSRSEWFTRAWTLQELLAPRTVEFFDSAWESIGTKADKIDLIEEITGVPSTALENGDCLWEFEITDKMAWASGREATRKEDIAYSLMGIFGVNIPLLYGEGGRAFTRLQEEIIRQANNTLFLWWGIGIPTHRLLADSPSSFERDVEFSSYSSVVPFSWTNIGLQLETKLFRCGIDLYGMVLGYETSSCVGAVILRKELFIDNVYHKVCTTSVPYHSNYLSRSGSITIMRGTRDQRIGEEDPEDTQCDLLQEPYLVEVRCIENMTIHPDVSSIIPQPNSTRLSWVTIRSNSIYEVNFLEPGWWTVASLTCELADSNRFRVSFAFDFDWNICLLMERLGAHNSSSDPQPKIPLQQISAESPGMDYGTVRYNNWYEVKGRIIESSEGKVVYFARMFEHGRNCLQLPAELFSHNRILWLSIDQTHRNKWLLNLSETAPYCA